ncbi:MAG: DUF1156 domain-containing protein [Thermoprotei archaeon]|nr:MAG: DUF1156 domain-containing protein [Thermoprotei archaeon]
MNGELRFKLKPVDDRRRLRRERLDSFTEGGASVFKTAIGSERRFIESPRFPFQEISEASGREKKGGGRPPYWEMVFWWTRKPLISARAIIAGALLPEDISRRSFLHMIGFGRGKSPHRVNPTIRFEGSLLDPFAGFGSIPLEALRLGLRATAVELVPAAYVFLKAVLEYPVRFGSQLVRDVERWGRWITEKLKDDPLIRELYEPDVAVYIGSWEVRCPHCGRWTPLVGNWWLARVRGKVGYERLAWMEPVVVGDRVEVKVVDLNRELGSRAVKDAKVEGSRILVGGREFRVPEKNINPRREQANCLHCHQPIRYVDPETGQHIVKPERGKAGKLVWLVKHALTRYNQEDNSLARLRLLVKVRIKKRDLEFEPCSQKDERSLDLARSEVEKLLKSGDPDIPKEGISLYSVRYLFPILYGMTEWYKLFNPRQLITLVKLIKLIREAGKWVEREKIEQGESSEEAFRYAEAVTAYLAIALCKYADYNFLCNLWDCNIPKISHGLTMRGIAMMWNWVDINPEINFTGSWVRVISQNVNSLYYVKSAINNSPKCVNVLLDDATVLNRLTESSFDIIVTDPPYYDDVPYCELSDFYYVWLKRTLSDVENGRLKPRFLPEAFFERIGEKWVEVSTQWERYALSEVSLNPPRLGKSATREDGVKHFQNLLNASFTTMASRLKDDGLLITYYAHTDPDAWKALLEAGWEAAGLRVTNAFPLTTESAQSVVKRGKLSMDTSIVVTWRKGTEGVIEASKLYDEMAEEASKRAMELIDLGVVGRDLVIGSLAAALAAATRYREVRVMKRIDVRTLVDNYVYPAALLGLARALIRRAEIREEIRSPDAMFYLLVKFTLGGARRKVLESTDARIFSIGTSLDLNTALKKWRMLRGAKEEPGARVAKAKTLVLVEPTSTDRSKLAELLEAREVGVAEPEIRCTVDALHTLEYLAVIHPREEFKRRLEEIKALYPTQVREALAMARIMAKVLPENDVEKKLCERILSHLAPPPPRLDFKGGVE